MRILLSGWPTTPVDGGGKVSAQAHAWNWPALVTAEVLLRGNTELCQWWQWCLSEQGKTTAVHRAAASPDHEDELMSTLLHALTASAGVSPATPR